MSKHSLSPAPLPPSKRLHSLSTSDPGVTPTSLLTFETALYDELILCIFSHLSWVDLCAVQATNKNWSRLAVDNQLWKSLYLKVYGRSRLRGARGFTGRMDGREVKPLPGRVKAEDIKDWKWMFRISSNWRKGRCSVHQLNDVVDSTQQDLDHHYQTHILLAGSLIITASARVSSAPTICLHSLACPKYVLVCGSTRHNTASQITTLALDQSPPVSGHNLHLASFLSTGEFIIFNISHTVPPTSSRKLTYVPLRGSSRASPIIQAVYHHPLLITLSQTFHLSIYDLSSDTVTHTQTLTSFTSFPPTSLVLSTPTPLAYKLVLTYSIPVYPAHWSVGATELVISGPNVPPATSSLPPSSDLSSPGVEPMTVTGSRTARALDIPQGWIDEHKLRSMREQWGRKVSRVADTQTDGKWVVLAPGDALPPDTLAPTPSPSDLSGSSAGSSPPHSPPCPISSIRHSPTSLQLYRLSLPSQSQWSSSTAIPKLTFVRNLHGQTSPVSTLALADGRCVSLGLNGSIWVWDLEGGTGAEVASTTDDGLNLDMDLHTSLSKGAVVFDERRIVTAGMGGIAVRRFDI